ncbi:hypothetical protein SLE2022_200930 [Rubroshorea leprosula]
MVKGIDGKVKKKGERKRKESGFGSDHGDGPYPRRSISVTYHGPADSIPSSQRRSISWSSGPYFGSGHFPFRLF